MRREEVDEYIGEIVNVHIVGMNNQSSFTLMALKLEGSPYDAGHYHIQGKSASVHFIARNVVAIRSTAMGDRPGWGKYAIYLRK